MQDVNQISKPQNTSNKAAPLSLSKKLEIINQRPAALEQAPGKVETIIEENSAIARF